MAEEWSRFNPIKDQEREIADLQARLRVVEGERDELSRMYSKKFVEADRQLQIAAEFAGKLAVCAGRLQEAESTLRRVGMRAQVQRDDEGKRFFCALCDREGPLNQIDHAKDCPLTDPVVRTVMGDLDSPASPSGV